MGSLRQRWLDLATDPGEGTSPWDKRRYRQRALIAVPAAIAVVLVLLIVDRLGVPLDPKLLMIALVGVGVPLAWKATVRRHRGPERLTTPVLVEMGEAWKELHAVLPSGWAVGRPTYDDQERRWHLSADDRHQGREVTVTATSEQGVVLELARQLSTVESE